MDVGMWLSVALALLNLALLVVLLRRSSAAAFERVVRDELRAARDDANRQARDLREELAAVARTQSKALLDLHQQLATEQQKRLEAVTTQLTAFGTALDTKSDALRSSLEQRQDGLREVVTAALARSAETTSQALNALADATVTRLEAVRATIEAQLKDIQSANTRQLDEIRKTVDEQLQTALEKRLTESFKRVGEQLESVQRGLGEMQALAAGVGDLKRVLTNVKARGTWAEHQLRALLDDILTPDQFAVNVATKQGTDDRVEFAVRLPGRDLDEVVWLPIDSKFPQESYVRLLNAAEAADADELLAASAELARTLRTQAQSIHAKYVDPPSTTEFAILYLPTEGLFAEVLRIPGLSAELQQKWRVLVAGPTTLASVLSTLRMGFQTLAIERRASEVWRVLGAVKTEFASFGDVLDKARKQLDRVSRTLDNTGVRTRAIERRLRDVEALPEGEVIDLLGLPEAVEQEA